MPEVKLPFGMKAFHVGSDEEARRIEDLARKRVAFATDYMVEKGWGTNPDLLSIEQILEIRAQPGWKEPT